jgi:hypothetical protein
VHDKHLWISTERDNLWSDVAERSGDVIEYIQRHKLIESPDPGSSFHIDGNYHFHYS